MYAEPDTRDERADAPTAKSRRQENGRFPQKAPDDRKEAPDRRRVWLRRLLYLLLPLVLIIGVWWYVTGGKVTTTDDANVDANKVEVATDVSGIVKEVDVTDNQHVQQGQVLYRLDPTPFQLALDRANAQLGMIANQLNALKANYQNTQAQIAQAQTDVDYYQTEFNRQQNLLKAHVTSQMAADTAQRNLVNAQQKLDGLRHQLAGDAANLSGKPDLPIEQQPQYKNALAQRDEAARELDDSVVRAAFSGIVTGVPSIAPGKYLAASTTAFYLVSDTDIWVDADPKETELTWVRVGQKATVTVDTYPNYEWHGTVESISPAAAQEFSLLPAQNTSGNWVKVVQRVPMRVRVDVSDKSMPPLRAGMSAEVSVDTGHARGWPHFIAALFGGGTKQVG